jgi:hypothetical protein
MPQVRTEPTTPSVRAGENMSCLRTHGHCDRHVQIITILKHETQAVTWIVTTLKSYFHEQRIAFKGLVGRFCIIHRKVLYCHKWLRSTEGCLARRRLKWHFVVIGVRTAYIQVNLHISSKIRSVNCTSITIGENVSVLGTSIWKSGVNMDCDPECVWFYFCIWSKRSNLRK